MQHSPCGGRRGSPARRFGRSAAKPSRADSACSTAARVPFMGSRSGCRFGLRRTRTNPSRSGRSVPGRSGSSSAWSSSSVSSGSRSGSGVTASSRWMIRSARLASATAGSRSSTPIARWMLRDEGRMSVTLPTPGSALRAGSRLRRVRIRPGRVPPPQPSQAGR